MGEGVRTDRGSALPAGKRGAPGSGREINRESMELEIRNLIVAWGEGPDPRDDDERVAAIRKGARFARPAPTEPLDEG
jgi:hypothetical protein